MTTTDPATLLEKATGYLAPSLPNSEVPHAALSPHPLANLAEVVRLHELKL